MKENQNYYKFNMLFCKDWLSFYFFFNNRFDESVFFLDVIENFWIFLKIHQNHFYILDRDLFHALIKDATKLILKLLKFRLLLALNKGNKGDKVFKPQSFEILRNILRINSFKILVFCGDG
jgi:hypothetical protein